MIFTLGIVSLISSLISNSYAAINMLIKSYGYLAIFILMAMESSSLPVPSEVILPLAGFFAAQGTINFVLAFIAGILGSIVGSLVDYAIGYYIGKDIVYKHLKFFHIKKESLDRFDAWFEKNGMAAIFFTRLVPIARTFINFPAGFAKMRLKEFLAYTIAGFFIWDLVLMLFGYYLHTVAVNSAVTALAAIGVFAILLYVVYKVAMKRMRK
jgi:membrane protein DedA with SNARE-associated domain